MKALSLLLSFCLVFNPAAFAQIAGQQTALKTEIFTPLHLRYVSYNQIEDNLNIILDKGNFNPPNASELQDNALPLLNYFFIGISLPSDSFWVNLRPDSQDKMIDSSLEKTDIGRILLEADLQLKKDIAQATSPQVPTGKEYWDKLYKKIDELFGDAEVSIPTLTRPWIVPDEVIVRETADSAYVYKATLKVMLEGDYLAGSQAYNFSRQTMSERAGSRYLTESLAGKDKRLQKLNEYSTQLIRELVLPGLNKEINSSQRYAALRQVYYSLILSQWFKARFTGQAGQYAALIDKKDLSGLISEKPWVKAAYFKEYQKSFTEREYNLKESVNAIYGRSVKSYYSGGVNMGLSMFVTVPAIGPEVVRPGVITEARPALPTTRRLPVTRAPIREEPGAPRAEAARALPAPKIVIPAVETGPGGPGGFYTRAPDTGANLRVTGQPGVDIQVTLTQPATERLSVREQRVRVIQMLGNIPQGIISEQIPQLFTPGLGAQERGARLEQLRAARSPQVYIVEDIPFIPVTGLLAGTSEYGAPMAVQLDLGKTFNQPVVIIDSGLVDNRVVEGYAVNMINRLSNEARSGRIPGAGTLPALSTLMTERPHEALPVLARVDKQVKANPRYNIAQIVPGHYAYGFGDLANPAAGLPEMNIPFTKALGNLQAPVYMARVTEIGRKDLDVVQKGPTTPTTPARQALLGIIAQPAAQQILSMGTMEKFRESVRGRIGGERVMAFANLLFEAKQALKALPDISPAETAILNPAPLVSTRIETAQTYSIPRDRWQNAALGQVNAVLSALGFEGMVSVQVLPQPQGVPQAVVLADNAPVPLEVGKPVIVRAQRLATPEAGRPQVGLVALVQTEVPTPPAVSAPNYAPQAAEQPALISVELSPAGDLSIRNLAPQPETRVEVTAFRAPQPATQLAPTMPATGLTQEIGGIDLRVLPIITQPLSNLSANLTKSTLRSLRNLDLDKEWAEIEKMIQAGMIPSAERIKENIQASCLQGEISLDIDRIVLNISKILKIEEARYVPTEPALRDILVVLGAASSPLEISQVFLGKI